MVRLGGWHRWLHCVGLVLVPPIAAAGALVGALVDRGKHKYDSVFEAVLSSQRVDIAITSVFSSEGSGVGVAFTC